MRRYRVTLPVEIGGRVYQFGEVAELELETAAQHAHALIAEEEQDGGDGEGHTGN